MATDAGLKPAGDIWWRFDRACSLSTVRESMLITKKFVFVHMPKTGGTFVTQVVKGLNDGGPNGVLGRMVTRLSGECSCVQRLRCAGM